MVRLTHPGDGRGRRGRRGAGSRGLRKRFLIVCEGAVTEPLYFKAFPLPKDVQVVVKGEGRNTTSLVHAAVNYADKREYDEVWVVYDQDDFGCERFNAAEAEIRVQDQKRDERWRAAWSNQAFEVWYLLHFQYFDGELHRHEVQKKVGELLTKEGLCVGYRKNHPSLYDLLLSRQQEAIRNAERLTMEHKIAPHGETPPGAADPCTTVHCLVEALNDEIR